MSSMIISSGIQILLAASLTIFCSARGNVYVKEKEDSDVPSSREDPSTKRSRKARALEPEVAIPLPEGTIKNPDVGETIGGRSQNSRKLREMQEVKGYVLEKDRSVSRLDGSRVRRRKNESERSRRQSRSERRVTVEVEVQKKGKKGTERDKRRKKKKPKSEKSEKGDSSKKEEKSKSSKKSEVEREKKERKSEKRELEEPKQPKPPKLQKWKKPWKTMFKRKRGSPEQSSAERCGTWA
ncbi:unnamed protein product [Caenorhabditis sp. 36 PRJEB53466]|nr:unnamed protein product [Caenorhabditis sp. 36 PRJEB53466]